MVIDESAPAVPEPCAARYDAASDCDRRAGNTARTYCAGRYAAAIDEPASVTPEYGVGRFVFPCYFLPMLVTQCVI